MTNFWNKLWARGDKEVEVAKSGDINYLTFKQQGETILTIVQPPTSYDGKTNVGGKISIFSASGQLEAEKNKSSKYGEPIILFNANNKAGLKIVDTLNNTKEILPEVLKDRPDIKVDGQKLVEDNSINIKKQNRISFGSSTMLEISDNNSVSIIKTPELNAKDKSILYSLLKFMVRSAVGKEQTYRANIMFLDPQDNLLKIAASYNMDGYSDRNIALRAGTGGAGKALQTNKPVKFDANVSSHSSMGVNPDEVWSDLKSILSVPIWDSIGNRLGVLSIDTDKDGPDTKWYKNSEFEVVISLAADVFGKILETKS
jgi:GAF domain